MRCFVEAGEGVGGGPGPQVHLAHRHPFLFLPLEDLEQPLLLGNPATGPNYISLDVRIFKLPHSRFCNQLVKHQHFPKLSNTFSTLCHVSGQVPLSFCQRPFLLILGEKMQKAPGSGIRHTVIQSPAPLAVCRWKQVLEACQDAAFLIYKTGRYPILSVWHTEGAEYVLFTSLFSLTPSANTTLPDTSPCFHSSPFNFRGYRRGYK